MSFYQQSHVGWVCACLIWKEKGVENFVTWLPILEIGENRSLKWKDRPLYTVTFHFCHLSFGMLQNVWQGLEESLDREHGSGGRSRGHRRATLHDGHSGTRALPLPLTRATASTDSLYLWSLVSLTHCTSSMLFSILLRRRPTIIHTLAFDDRDNEIYVFVFYVLCAVHIYFFNWKTGQDLSASAATQVGTLNAIKNSLFISVTQATPGGNPAAGSLQLSWCWNHLQKRFSQVFVQMPFQATSCILLRQSLCCLFSPLCLIFICLLHDNAP